jgi:hypothetical protein
MAAAYDLVGGESMEIEEEAGILAWNLEASSLAC